MISGDTIAPNHREIVPAESKDHELVDHEHDNVENSRDAARTFRVSKTPETVMLGSKEHVVFIVIS